MFNLDIGLRKSDECGLLQFSVKELGSQDRHRDDASEQQVGKGVRRTATHQLINRCLIIAHGSISTATFLVDAHLAGSTHITGIAPKVDL